VPKVSVIIPTFNRKEFLRSAIQSVLNQTLRNFEIIVVDDGSAEDVRTIVNGFQNNRIKYLRHEKNKGEAAARNTGIINSRGEYIAFLDDDDTWFPEKLSLQTSLLEKTTMSTGAVYTGYLAVDHVSHRTLYKKVPEKKGNVYKDLLVKNLIGTPSTVLIRRACIDHTGLFDENIYYGVDHDFYLRIAKEFDFDFIEEPLVTYTIHENRITNDPEIVAKGLQAFSHKYREKLEKGYCGRSQFLGQGYLSVGVSYCYKGEMLKGIKALLKSIMLYPFEPRGYLNLSFALTGRRSFTKLKKIKDTFVSPFRSSVETKN
jgi:glycosyltransferase involved in cell wall biosynthesis